MSKPSNVTPVGDGRAQSYNRYRFQTNFQPKNVKPSRYFADPRIVPRVRQYLEENKDKYFIDFNDMVTELMKKYKEYGRRKRSDFKSMVEKAFTLVLESYEKKNALQPGGDDSSNSEISDMELIGETVVDENNVANQQMLNLYTKEEMRNSPSMAAMDTDEEKVINLSSDEEDIQVGVEQRAKRFKHNNVPATSAPAGSPVIRATNAPDARCILETEDVSVTLRPSSVKKMTPSSNAAKPSESVQAGNKTPTVTPAAVAEATPATSRLNRSGRKRVRNAADEAAQRSAVKTETERQTNKTDLPVRTPAYTFHDIGGCTKVLQEVCKLLVHIRHPEVYAQVGVSPPRGFLLHGPPGCGKTLLAGAIAGELKIPLLKVSGPELVAGVSGESEERIRNLFDQAVSIAPCVLFLDEVDAISPNRSTAQREMERRIVAQLLSCLDDLGERENGTRVLVVGATNRPDSLDPALRRAGRFDREVCLGIPDRAARAQILRVVCKNLSLDPEVASDQGMDYLASITPGFVGADLKALTREAAMVAINRIFRTLQSEKAEEVEMVEAPADKSVASTAAEKVAAEGVESGPMDEASPEVEPVEPEPISSEPPRVESIITEVKEIEINEVGVQDESVENLIIEEEELVEEPADGVGPATAEDVEVKVTTECVDLEIDEPVLGDERRDEDGVTITIVTPDGDCETITVDGSAQTPTANGVSDEDMSEAIAGEEVIAAVPTDADVLEEIIPDAVPEQMIIPALVPEISPAVYGPPVDPSEVIPSVVVVEVVPQVVPEVAVPQVVVPQVVPPEGVPPRVVVPQIGAQEGVSRVLPQVVPENPAGVVPVPSEVPPQPIAAEAKAAEDSVMVVEEVEGMGLCQQVATTTDWSAELKELLTWLRDSPPLSAEQLKGLNVNLDDFREALRHVQPSAKREGFATVPDVTWDDVGSLGSVRTELQLAILAPVRYPEQFAQLGITSPTGVLLCGPPGCGKTLLAKAIANEAGVNFISVKGPELMNMYVGESERAVRQVFQRARNSAPCVIFFDELDSLCPRRSENAEGNVSSRVVNQLLTEMDGVESRSTVFLMAATNRPDILDPAVLRPGRLDKVLYVGLPNAADRYDILRAVTKNGTRPVLNSDVNLSQIAQFPACEGYSGADLAALVREAGVQALREFVTNPAAAKQAGGSGELAVASRHFAAAIPKIRPSVSEKDQKNYEALRRLYSTVPQRGEDTMDTT